MRVPVVLGAAAVALLAARVARSVANDDRPKKLIDTPYAPSPGAAPFASLGYRELAADMLWVRLTGYYGGDSNTAEGIGGLVEAIITLDPHFARVYEWGARAMTSAHYGVDQDAYLRAIAILERGRELFPDDYRLPYLAGQIYTQDLVTNDPAQRRDWDEKGTLSIESALRKPGAPAEMAAWAAVMRTKLGEHQRAVDGLREMLLLTPDPAGRAPALARQARGAAAARRERARRGAHRLAHALQHAVAGRTAGDPCDDVHPARRAPRLRGFDLDGPRDRRSPTCCRSTADRLRGARAAVAQLLA